MFNCSMQSNIYIDIEQTERNAKMGSLSVKHFIIIVFKIYITEIQINITTFVL